MQLLNGATIRNGTLISSSGGVFRANNGQTVFLDSLTNAGNFIGDDNSTTVLSGTITNTGDFTLTTNGNFTNLRIDTAATLTGAGTVTLTRNSAATGASNARISGSGTLTNQSTIQGEGYVGANETTIINQSGGLIDANISGRVLDLDPNAVDGLTNVGLIRASNGGILQLNGNGGGAFSNSGTIAATTGGVLRFNGTVTSSGTVDVGSNTLTGTGSYTQTAGSFILTGGTAQLNSALNFQGGLVDARGTINAAITNGANLRPALGGAGLIVNGAVSLLNSSQLTFQLGGLTQGSQYGYLNVNGTVALNGQLVVTFVNGFQATNSNNFTVLTSSAALSGTFTNVLSGNRVGVTDGSGTFLVTYSGNEVILSNFLPSGIGAPASAAAPEVPQIVAPDAAEAPDTADAPAAVRTGSRAGRTRTPRPRSGIAVQNTDQLLDLIENAGAPSENGAVVVRPQPAKRAPRGKVAPLPEPAVSISDRRFLPNDRLGRTKPGSPREN